MVYVIRSDQAARGPKRIMAAPRRQIDAPSVSQWSGLTFSTVQSQSNEDRI
jgi:hypothetical protein